MFKVYKCSRKGPLSTFSITTTTTKYYYLSTRIHLTRCRLATRCLALLLYCVQQRVPSRHFILGQ